MFTKYNINDLYLAYVLEITPCKSDFIQYTSTGYFTILKKECENYIDLQNEKKVIRKTILPNQKCYVIYEIEPLSKHYLLNDNKLTKVKALNISKTYRHVISDKIKERSK